MLISGAMLLGPPTGLHAVCTRVLACVPCVLAREDVWWSGSRLECQAHLSEGDRHSGECVAFRGGNHPFGSHRCQPLPSFFGFAWHEECSWWCGWSLRFVGLSHGWIQHDGQSKAQKSVLSFIPTLDITCDVDDRLLPLPAFQVVDQVCEDFLPLQQFFGDDHLDAQLGQVRTQFVPLRLVTKVDC